MEETQWTRHDVQSWLRVARRLPWRRPRPRLRAMAHERSLSRSRRRSARSELQQVPAGAGAWSASPRARAGTKVPCISATAATSCGRHPQQPHHALAGGDRRGERIPPALNNANGNTATVRAGSSPASTMRAASRAPRVRRHHHGHLGKFDGKPLNSPNDIVVKSTTDLVHRSAVRHPRQLRRARGDARAADQRLSASTPRRAAPRGDRRRRPNRLASPDRSKLSSGPAPGDRA